MAELQEKGRGRVVVPMVSVKLIQALSPGGTVCGGASTGGGGGEGETSPV